MTKLVGLMFFCFALGGLAFAEIGAEARRELERARTAASEARRLYSDHHSDQNLWQEAIRYGNRALALAPEAPEVHRFLAETYTTTRWQARAWASWQRYAAGVPQLDREALRQLAEVGHELALSRARAGDADGAAAVYTRLLEVDGEDVRALGALAAHHQARGDADAALPLWQEVARLAPGDETAAYHAAFARDSQRYGETAARAYQEGRRAEAGGRLPDALAAFEAALAASPGYRAALQGAAALSQELGYLERAEGWWQRLQTLEPGSEEAQAALTLLAEQRLWGAQAVSKLQGGLRAEAEGWVPEASVFFQHAAAANPRYPDAFVHLARNHQRQGEPARAYLAWQQVLKLAPDHPEAKEALAVIERQALTVGGGRAFYQGLERYARGDWRAAAERLAVATTLQPRHEAAWAYLARSRLALGEDAGARRAFEHARRLNPDDASYRHYLLELGGER